MKKWKGKNEKSKKLETVGAVTHTHTHKHVIKDNVGADALKSAHEKKKNIRIRTRVIVPLIVVLMLICVITICVIGVPFGRPQENAEISKDIETNKEEILAETVQAGETYTVPTNGIYKIELHGGHGEGIGRTVKVVKLQDM